MKKKILSMLLTGIVVLSMAGCGSANAESTAVPADTAVEESQASAEAFTETDSTLAAVPTSDISIAVIFKALNAEYWKTMQAGCEQAAADLGIQVTVLGPNAESEIAQQVTMIEEQLSAGVNAICIAPCDESAVIGAVSDYVGKVPILAVDTDFDLEGKTAFIGTGNANAAKLGGEYAAKQMGEDGKAILIGGQQGEGTSTQRLEGFQAGLEENGCSILETQYGKNTADGAMAVMEDMLTKYQNDIGAVLCMNDDMIQGCQLAVKNAKMEGITLVGFNGDSAVLSLIKSGEIQATVAQQPYEMGYQAVEQACKAAQGEHIEEHQDVPAVLITQENVDTFIK